MASKPRIQVIHDTRYRKDDGTHAVKLRLGYHRKYQYIGLDSIPWLSLDIPASLTQAQWAEVYPKRGRVKNLDLRRKYDALLAHAKETLSGLEPPFARAEFTEYDWQRFRDKFLQVPGEDSSVFFWFARTVSQARQEERHNTAAGYEDTAKAIQAFAGDSLPLESITPAWLRELERHWKAQGRKAGGIAKAMRDIRAVFNAAIDGGAIAEEKYPFGRRGFSIKAGRKAQKKVLQWEELVRLWFYQPQAKAREYYILEAFGLDMWKLSYLWQGCNPADMFRFRNRDVRHGRITFDRKKTANTKRGGESVTVYVDGEAEEIIRRWNEDTSPDGYLLPVLVPGMKESEIVRAVNNRRAAINRALKKVSRALGLPPLSLAWARPTFATLVKRHGAETRQISAMLGHSNERTTEIYLGREDEETLRASARRAIPGASGEGQEG